MTPNKIVRRGLSETFVAAVAHVRPERLWRALLGGDFQRKFDAAEFSSYAVEETLPFPRARGTLDAPKPEALFEQLVPLFDAERARGAETRRRSEQAFTRLLALAALVAAVTGWSFANADSPGMKAAAWLGAAATALLAIAVIAILNNLGKERWYAPISLDDFLRQGATLKALSRKHLLPEYLQAIAVAELRNDDAVDRLHTAHTLTFAGAFVCVVSALTIAAFRGPRPSAPADPHGCTCVCAGSSPSAPTESGPLPSLPKAAPLLLPPTSPLSSAPLPVPPTSSTPGPALGTSARPRLAPAPQGGIHPAGGTR
ncbi:MAG TPA: hypothetical protein VGG39_37400 [Polyangiaceae bacterium]|jgi:hypothetical protein